MVIARQREFEDFFKAFERYREIAKSYIRMYSQYKEVWDKYIKALQEDRGKQPPQPCIDDDKLYRAALNQWMRDHNAMVDDYKKLGLTLFKVEILAFIPCCPLPSMTKLKELNKKRAQLEWIVVQIHSIATRNADKMVDKESASDYLRKMKDVVILPEKTYPSPQEAFASILPAFTHPIFAKNTIIVRWNSFAKEGVKIDWARETPKHLSAVDWPIEKKMYHTLPCNMHNITNSSAYDDMFHKIVSDYEIAVLRFEDLLSKHNDKTPHKLIIPLLRVQSAALDPEMEASATLSTLAIGIARAPLIKNLPLELVLVAPKNVDFDEWSAALAKKKELLHKSFFVPKQVDLCGAQDNSYDWVRNGVFAIDRLQRTMITMHTLNTIACRAYRFEPNGADAKLNHVDYMRDNTRIVTGEIKTTYPGAGTFKTKLLKMPGAPQPGRTIMEIAASVAKRGHRICAVSAASAYHCGGGALTGGRHALEESWCIQSSLLESLINSQIGGMEAADPNVHGYGALLAGENPDNKKEDLKLHIPEYGCLISPRVEIFRGSCLAGYPYYDKPVALQGVCSFASYNRNPKMNDCPVDAPERAADYMEGVRKKFDAAISGALRMKAEVLVIPDAGCGVYGNNANAVGQVLGEVLKDSYGCFKLVIITGLQEFCTSVDRYCKFPKEDMFNKPPGAKGAKRGAAKKNPIEATLDMLVLPKPLDNLDFMNVGPLPANERLAVNVATIVALPPDSEVGGIGSPKKKKNKKGADGLTPVSAKVDNTGSKSPTIGASPTSPTSPPKAVAPSPSSPFGMAPVAGGEEGKVAAKVMAKQVVKQPSTKQLAKQPSSKQLPKVPPSKPKVPPPPSPNSPAAAKPAPTTPPAVKAGAGGKVTSNNAV
eukprot:GEMP01003114.1.p1 GENE.GEMP01003114.1~~GEMP01003114.1.p1  ORF type:complete len:881 (+),score=152.02 GEMP01003114.1:104-2746(+)